MSTEVLDSEPPGPPLRYLESLSWATKSTVSYLVLNPSPCNGHVVVDFVAKPVEDLGTYSAPSLALADTRGF